jgi:hypothetical protein
MFENLKKAASGIAKSAGIVASACIVVTTLTAGAAGAATVGKGAVRADSSHMSGVTPRIGYCGKPLGTILTSTPTSNTEAWLPTTVYSNYEAGPGTITYSENTTSTTGITLTASFELEESMFFASATETYGVQLTHSSSKSQTWTYALAVPSGETARLQQYHEGWEMGIKQTYVAWTAAKGCYIGVETSLTGNYFPNDSTDSGQYCWALTSSQRPGAYAASACHDSFSKLSAGEQAAARGVVAHDEMGRLKV